MQTTFVIDRDRTFREVKQTLLSMTPKLRYGSDTGEQATTKDQVPLWAGQFLFQYKNSFDNEVAEVVKITIASETDPAKSIPDMSPVEIEGLTVGVMEGRNGGFALFFRADGIAPAASSGVKPTRPSEKSAA